MIRATAHVLRGVGVRHAVKTLVRRALEDVGVSHDAAAAFADVSRQRIEHQLDTAHDAQPPMFLLAVLPAEVRERIIVALRALHDDRAMWNAPNGLGLKSGNRHRERLWFSPACLGARQPSLWGAA